MRVDPHVRPAFTAFRAALGHTLIQLARESAALPRAYTTAAPKASRARMQSGPGSTDARGSLGLFSSRSFGEIKCRSCGFFAKAVSAPARL